MLLVVLLLVLAAGGVLAVAVLVGEPDLAWLSVLASALGVALLVADRRRLRAGPARGRRTAEPGAGGRDPGEERSNAAAAADPDAEVLVLDELPRYHVRTCEWLGARKTIALRLREARELGFTPCAYCAPNATLAAEVRRSDHRRDSALR
ncbi:hypothetical protein [Saccharopolyspora phatthalungensis]|uniref:Uncharacterized protein n=1 Tax=Saccharopolyspora phatthalungensis TaxID=664693 RepID=A0A840QF73_9PSEU|nr:hypothetical protein [Saccharopolyspora phatthalungensis]MBB5155723.1 hypothetical protein [Saccharopolyspora phatthalungensis]